jgi:signal transduction histidine kinase
VADFFALDDPWERRGALSRQDWVVGVVAVVLTTVLLELSRSAGGLDHVAAPPWVQDLAAAAGAALLVGRRRWPLSVAVLAAAHMFVLGVTMPQVMGQFAMQVVYFTAIFSGVAWARSRRDMALVVGGVIVFMFLWLAWQFALGSGIDDIRADLGPDAGAEGLVPPVTAYVAITALVNVLYFGGAVVGGQVAWRAARQQAGLAEQASTISRQAADLRRQAVLTERLRIARELHDVVAHHVSVIGIQAAASRRVLRTDPEAAADALASVETSSREAVEQMRQLVGALRDPADSDPGEGTPRAPEPGLCDVGALVEAADGPGLAATYDLVESRPGAAGDVPATLGLALYRITQEALTNVRRHSTARTAAVVVRVDVGAAHPYAEVEVVDDGRPRPGTSGTGLGLLGVRERAAARRGVVDIGPRVGGGFRVRVRFPLEEGGAA